jgi:uncharacterized protein (TIGR02246 family)
MTTTAEALDDRVQAFGRALNAQDATALASLFTEDAEFVNIFASRMRGKSDIEKQHAAAFSAALFGVHVTLVTTDVKELSDGVAIVHAEWTRLVTATAETGTFPPGKGVLTIVALRKQDDWLFAAAQNTQYTVPGHALGA